MKILLFTFFFICSSYISSAQILNAESLRKVTDTSGWSGSTSLHFALKRNANDLFTIANDIHIQYKMNKNLVLFKNHIGFLKIEGDNFSNFGISHLRYNYKYTSRMAIEVFVQGQYNKVSKIDFRGLVGAGPRFKLSTSEKYKFYLGTLVMYEQEELSDGSDIERNARGSCYLSFSLYPTDRLTLVSTTYYQPILTSISDYRISSQSSLLIDIFKNLALKTSYTFTYNATPAIDVPESQYSLTSGITYSFD
ncbi:MAG: DUF481 domain-containing protein [Flavobacteriaceae bacterium]|nr:DUF481 domain-containing protein [Flavobacteriaceae bacterium]